MYPGCDVTEPQGLAWKGLLLISSYISHEKYAVGHNKHWDSKQAINYEINQEIDHYSMQSDKNSSFEVGLLACIKLLYFSLPLPPK